MGWRLFVFGTVAVLLGGLVFLSPIDQGPVSTAQLDSGTSVDVAVPRSTSWTGAPVDVLLSWGTTEPPSTCSGYCPSRFGPDPTNLTHLVVYDCGTAPCTGTGNYTLLGSTDAATGGSSGFPAAPGHHYQVWVWASQNTSPLTSTPVRYAVESPVLGGAAGAAMLVAGGSAMVAAVLRWRRRRSRTGAPDSLA
jgi:hypothetical protein